MKRKTIDAFREVRLWTTQIIKPIGELVFGAGLLAREFNVGEKVERMSHKRKMKKCDFTVYDRTEPKKEPIPTKESLEFLDAAARLKHLENLGNGINSR